MLPITVAKYRPHLLHGPDRPWPETNCYTDLWIELLHSLGCEPSAGMAFLLSNDFDGDQWEFFKFPPEDLRALYGIEVDEMNVWRPMIDHIETHLELGHLLTVEVDAFHLPDTAGTSYGTIHQKTTIVVHALDRTQRRIEYFHNGGFYALGEPDYAHVVRLAPLPVEALVPYVEVIDLSRLRRVAVGVLVARTTELVREHLGRRPQTNPVQRLGERVVADIPWLSEQGIEMFHRYAFGTLRQCGAWAGAAAGFIAWLADYDADVRRGDASLLHETATHFGALANAAKTCQFQLARATAGRSVDLTGTLAEMTAEYGVAFEQLIAIYGAEVRTS